MNNCATCRWWLPRDEDGDDRRAHGADEIIQPLDYTDLEDYGKPMPVPFEMRRCGAPTLTFCERPATSAGAMLADGSEYFAGLYTGPDFGCVNHAATEG